MFPSIMSVFGCAHCEFKADWSLGTRPFIQVFEHVKSEHPEKWSEEDEEIYLEWMALNDGA